MIYFYAIGNTGLLISAWLQIHKMNFSPNFYSLILISTCIFMLFSVKDLPISQPMDFNRSFPSQSNAFRKMFEIQKWFLKMFSESINQRLQNLKGNKTK